MKGRLPEQEPAGCFLCPDVEPRPLFEVWDRMFDVPGKFTFAECPSCGLKLLSNRPTVNALAAHYPEESYYAYGGVTGGRRGWLSATRQAWLRSKRAMTRGMPRLGAAFGADYALAASRPPGSVVEVGCGAGETLDTYKALGWKTVGVEVSAAARREAHRRGHTTHSIFEARNLPREGFDLVRMRHVLEHMADPLSALRTAWTVLRTGGTVAIDVPNFGGLLYRLFGAHFWQIDAPRHLYGFTPSTLARAMELAGFEGARVRTYSSGSGIGRCVALRLKDRKVPGFRSYRLASAGLAGRGFDAVLDGLLSPLARAVDLSGRGENLWVTARKTGNGE
ncbi:MAG: class I SAM-dependent methyltransferase [Nitrospirae bacterium]|nr:class I SAM-dependent methyltransferase [Nitrospirota bacterium]